MTPLWKALILAVATAKFRDATAFTSAAPRRSQPLTLHSPVSLAVPVPEKEKLNEYPPLPPGCPFSPEEWAQRCSLAVSYRIAFMEDWHMNIFNHITLRVVGSEGEPDGPHFLLNDYGQAFDEVTASSLLKVTLNGAQVPPPTTTTTKTTAPPGRGRGRVFKAGYVLHSALHAGRDDVAAVWHCHHVDSTAVCQTAVGLLPISQEATFALAKGLRYHPYEGSVNSQEEMPRFLSSLGPTDRVLMLEDHGPLVVGGGIEEAYSTMWFLTRACTYQIRSMSSVGGDVSRIHVPTDEVQREMDRRMESFDEAPAVASGEGERGNDGGSGREDGSEEGNEGAAETHDTEGLMFACARRAAERHFGAENIYA